MENGEEFSFLFVHQTSNTREIKHHNSNKFFISIENNN
jgi:hypothetical protein